MRVRFKINLGSNDAQPRGLDFKLCGAGMELDVPEAAGKWLVAKGHATEVVVEAVAKPAAIQGVPVESKPAPLAARHKSEKPTLSKES